MHSLLAKGRLLYTHDETIAELCARLREIGERDTRRCSCCAPATEALPPIDKAHKWLVTRGDLDYTALWILYAATPLAQVEVIGAGLLADREVIPQALAAEPGVLQDRSTPTCSTRRRPREAVQAALDAVDGYLARAGAAAVRAGARPPARGRRGALGHRDRGPLHSATSTSRA